MISTVRSLWGGRAIDSQGLGFDRVRSPVQQEARASPTSRRRGRSAMRSFPMGPFAARAFGLALLALAANVAVAAGPVGDEYGINDRPLPPKQWWTSCTDDAGRVASVVADCSGEGCDKPGDVYFQRVDAGGKRLGVLLRVNDDPAWRLGMRVVCSGNGWVLAQWVEGGCSKFRAVDPSGQLAGAAMVASDVDCRTRASLAIDDDARIFAAWPGWVPSGGSRILARRYGADGVAKGEAVMVSEDEAGRRLQPKVSVDDTGNALVAWIGGGEGSAPVMARFLGKNGQPSSAGFRIDGFGFGENLDPAIRPVSTGVFEVAWTNVLEGGRVARLVDESAAAPVPAPSASPSAASSAAPIPPVDAPAVHFGAPRLLDAHRGEDDLRATLARGTPPVAVVSTPYGRHLRSEDGSAHWGGAFATSPDLAGREFLGSDGAGTWIALRVPDGPDDLGLARSTDDGETWATLAAVLAGPQNGHVVDARVRGAGSTWVAAWTVGGTDPTAVVFARSVDGGLTWSKPKSYAMGGDRGVRGFDLATDGDGTWIAMLADTGVRFVRSTDDGATWKTPPPAVESAVCENCAGAWRSTQVGLAADGAGAWVAVFSAFLLDASTQGRDGDVYALRSADDGATWKPPVAVNAWATSDGSPDFHPSVATDAEGTWLATWTTHHPVVDGDNLDSDVVHAFSTDDGATWTTPSLLSPSMADDSAADERTGLVATGDGRWLALWERHDFLEPDGYARGDLMVASANAACGNGVLEAGEACDDANTDDDDGCDSNCTVSGCGNGIVNDNESCDVGSAGRPDLCSADCQAPYCGDGVVSGGEACDDGNLDDGDACSNTCGVTTCGDGIVRTGVDECDEGGRSTIHCTPDCKLPVCGDGFVAAYGEACDDGNTVDDDACPNDCSKATCGDGVTSLGWEECDAADPRWAAQCTADCRSVDVCGDANADGDVTTQDALLVLRRAVGLAVDCPRAACDMDANGKINVTDASTDLRKAVGLPVREHCSIGTGTIVFWVETTKAVASFQIDVDYSSTGGEFPGSGSGVACESVPAQSDEFLVAFNDSEATWTLTAGFVALETFTGPLDLFRCRFVMPEDRSDAHFAVRVVDAGDPDGEAVTPLPLLGYRVE
jgi:cysteine-rich repeat protein